MLAGRQPWGYFIDSKSHVLTNCLYTAMLESLFVQDTSKLDRLLSGHHTGCLPAFHGYMFCQYSKIAMLSSVAGKCTLKSVHRRMHIRSPDKHVQLPELHQCRFTDM